MYPFVNERKEGALGQVPIVDILSAPDTLTNDCLDFCSALGRTGIHATSQLGNEAE